MNKLQLTERLGHWTELAARLSHFALNEEDLDLLQGLLREHREREQLRWTRDKAQQAVDILFPSYRRSSGGRQDAKRDWHEKSWWWNGARITQLSLRDNGDVEVDLASYVGCGDTDTEEGLVLKREWLEAEDMAQTLEAFMASCVQAQVAQERQEELAQAEAALQAAQARLAHLKKDA